MAARSALTRVDGRTEDSSTVTLPSRSIAEASADASVSAWPSGSELARRIVGRSDHGGWDHSASHQRLQVAGDRVLGEQQGARAFGELAVQVAQVAARAARETRCRDHADELRLRGSWRQYEHALRVGIGPARRNDLAHAPPVFSLRNPP